MNINSLINVNCFHVALSIVVWHYWAKNAKQSPLSIGLRGSCLDFDWLWKPRLKLSSQLLLLWWRISGVSDFKNKIETARSKINFLLRKATLLPQKIELCSWFHWVILLKSAGTITEPQSTISWLWKLGCRGFKTVKDNVYLPASSRLIIEFSNVLWKTNWLLCLFVFYMVKHSGRFGSFSCVTL